MTNLKITSWNIEHLDRLLKNNLSDFCLKRLAAIREEIFSIDPDILLILEGPNSNKIDSVAKDILNKKYIAIKAQDDTYDIKGIQWMWFFVKPAIASSCSLLPCQTWYDYTGSKKWKVHYWGKYDSAEHFHYRKPQVLVMELNGQRIEFIGAHLKSKFVNQGEKLWKGTAAQNKLFIDESLKARIKLATEAENIRKYIDKRFEQTEKPAIFVMGDFNDGPGKEYFEQQYLFFDLISNIQGDIFFASKFLNHALFDYSEHLRWTCCFDDFVEGTKDAKILIDHILFTQPLVRWNLDVCVEPKAGLIEHEIHELINSKLPSNIRTSDHHPISVQVSIK